MLYSGLFTLSDGQAQIWEVTGNKSRATGLSQDINLLNLLTTTYGSPYSSPFLKQFDWIFGYVESKEYQLI